MEHNATHFGNVGHVAAFLCLGSGSHSQCIERSVLRHPSRMPMDRCYKHRHNLQRLCWSAHLRSRHVLSHAAEYGDCATWCRHSAKTWLSGCAGGACPTRHCPIDMTSPCRYHVRLDAASTRHTRLLFCTTGILLRRLASDSQLSAVSHVIVDEVRRLTGPALADDAHCHIMSCTGPSYNLVMILEADGGCPQTLGKCDCKTVT
jgi:hypothetical protein